MDFITFPEHLLITSDLSCSIHGVILLPDAASYDKLSFNLHPISKSAHQCFLPLSFRLKGCLVVNSKFIQILKVHSDSNISGVWSGFALLRLSNKKTLVYRLHFRFRGSQPKTKSSFDDNS